MTSEVDVLHVAVGSSNPAKIRSVRKALEKILARTRRRAIGDDDDDDGSGSSALPSSQWCPTTTTTTNTTTMSIPEMNVRGFAVPSGVPDQPMGDEETVRGAKNRARAAHDAFVAERRHEPHLAVGLEGGLEYGVGRRPSFSAEEEEEEEIERDTKQSTTDPKGGEEKTAVSSSSSSSPDLICMAWMAIYGRRTKRVLKWTSRECVDDDTDGSVGGVDVGGGEGGGGGGGSTSTSTGGGGGVAEEERTAAGDVGMTWGTAKTGTFRVPPMVADLVLKDGLELGYANDRCFASTESKHGSGAVGILTYDLIDRSDYYEHALILAMIPWIRPDVYP